MRTNGFVRRRFSRCEFRTEACLEKCKHQLASPRRCGLVMLRAMTEASLAVEMERSWAGSPAHLQCNHLHKTKGPPSSTSQSPARRCFGEPSWLFRHAELGGSSRAGGGAGSARLPLMRLSPEHALRHRATIAT
eukprot:2956051-Amphidinium_carterae.1